MGGHRSRDGVDVKGQVGRSEKETGSRDEWTRKKLGAELFLE